MFLSFNSKILTWNFGGLYTYIDQREVIISKYPKDVVHKSLIPKVPFLSCEPIAYIL